MPATFDPFLEWLRIPADQQPPNHYRLLGLQPFESDPAVIDAAINRLVERMQRLSHGPHVESAQKILNNIAQARLCLSDPIKKNAYDRSLNAHLTTSPAKTQRAADVPSVAPGKNSGGKLKPSKNSRNVAKTADRVTTTHHKDWDPSPNLDARLKQVKLAVAAMLVLGVVTGTSFVWMAFGGNSRVVNPGIQIAQNDIPNDLSETEDSNLDAKPSPRTNSRSSQTATSRSPATTADPKSLQAAEADTNPASFEDVAKAKANELGIDGDAANDATDSAAGKAETPPSASPTTPMTEQTIPQSAAATKVDPNTLQPVAGQSGVYHAAKQAVFEPSVGEFMGIEGSVVATRTSTTGKTVYLMFSKQKNELVEVRASAKVIKLEEIEPYVGKKIRVRGEVKKEYGSNAIGIEISTLDQIDILE